MEENKKQINSTNNNKEQEMINKFRNNLKTTVEILNRAKQKQAENNDENKDVKKGEEK